MGTDARVIAVACGLLAVVALCALIANRVPWQLKLALIVVTVAFPFHVYATLSDFEGWPSGTKPSRGTQLVASIVREPAPGDPGGIFLWVATGDEPRAHRLPYDRPLHEQLHRASRAMKAGARVGVRVDRGSSERAPKVRLYELPPPGSEPKTEGGTA